MVSTIMDMGEDAVFAAVQAALDVHNRETGKLLKDLATAEERRRTTHGCWVEVSDEEFWYIKGYMPMWWDDDVRRYRDCRGRFLPSRYAEMRRIFASAGVRWADGGVYAHYHRVWWTSWP